MEKPPFQFGLKTIFTVVTGVAVMMAAGIAILPRFSLYQKLRLFIVVVAAIGFLLQFVPDLIDILLRKLIENKKPQDE
jgi:hypothetical protein